ncbi:hypothetical protein [Paenibacillus glycanilyticus]|uniref:Uncharacterized protein n=1 Tax=Paenibacillus glycanilyticus TaxID=126569 RepID=A0ABQ6GB19_9BACL|nr:hypothetical protein [Paenibacillus glycanilyticus]GLX67695.1 hypothetical protein MU1_20400 [Paenibacillus glycanilyticus]
MAEQWEEWCSRQKACYMGTASRRNSGSSRVAGKMPAAGGRRVGGTVRGVVQQAKSLLQEVGEVAERCK